MKEVKELGRKLDEPRSDSSKGGVDQIIWHLPMGEQDLHVRAGEESNNCEAESKHDSSFFSLQTSDSDNAERY